MSVPLLHMKRYMTTTKSMSLSMTPLTKKPQLYSMHMTRPRIQELSRVPRTVQYRGESITSSTTGEEVPDSILKLKDDEYRQLADNALELISSDLEDLFEDKNILDADVENSAGIVTLTTSEGTYVINKQPPNKQIWLSSPLSGPKRFDYLNHQWTCMRNKQTLHEILTEEINEIFGDFEFSDRF